MSNPDVAAMKPSSLPLSSSFPIDCKVFVSRSSSSLITVSLISGHLCFHRYSTKSTQGPYTLALPAVHLKQQNNIAYLRKCDLYIDISDLENLTYIETDTNQSERPYGHVIEFGDYLFCVSGSGISIFDIRNPRNPLFIKKIIR